MKPDTKEFLLKEYETLKREVEIRIKHLFTIFYYSLVACSAVWIWIYSNIEIVKKIEIILWLPFIIVVVSFYRNITLNNDIKKIGDYIKNLENEFKLPNNLGWETSLRGTKRNWYSSSYWWEIIYWIILLLLNLLLIIISKCYLISV